MATVDPANALPHFQERVGTLYSEILMRDVVITELEARCAALEAEVSQLRGRGGEQHPVPGVPYSGA